MFPDDFSAGAIPADGQPGAGQQQPQDPPGNREPADGTEPPSSPDGTTEGQQGEDTQAPKTFTQAELDKVVQSEKAKAEARAERRVLRILAKQQGAPASQSQAPAGNQQQANDRPTLAQFGGDQERFTDALTDWKLDQRDRQSQAQHQNDQHRTIQQKTEGFYAEAAKIPGFDREAFDELDLTPTIVHAMLGSDVAPQLMALMAESPEEVSRIAKLPPARQGPELGKLEVKAAARKAAPSRVSNAPAPMEGIGGRGNGSHQGNVEGMPDDQYRAMRGKQGATWYRGR